MKLKHNCWDCRQKAMKQCKHHKYVGSIVEMAGGWDYCKLKPTYTKGNCKEHTKRERWLYCVFDSEEVIECNRWEQKSWYKLW